jgi:hypothetical protein
VGLFDVLRGERAPRRPNLDRIFAMTTAEMTLKVNLELEPLPVSGVCFRPVDMSAFAQTVREIDRILEDNGGPDATVTRREKDEHGFQWIVIEDPQFTDLVTATHHVNQTLQDHGFGEQLLCSLFAFRPQEGDTAYLVYGYKRGTFYPFIPTGDHERDNTAELRLGEALKGELPIEEELERWYPLWGHPVVPEARK